MTLRILREWQRPPLGVFGKIFTAFLHALKLCHTKQTRNPS